MGMDFVNVGRIVNTHGIKGEIRILSDFELKEQVFLPGNKLYIGDGYIEEEITSYRHHKEFEMVCLKGYDNINQVLKFMKMNVYVKRNELDIKDYLLEDLVGMNVVLDQEIIGKINDVVYNNGNNLIYVVGDKSFYVPIVDDFILEVDVNKKVVKISEATKGLM